MVERVVVASDFASFRVALDSQRDCEQSDFAKLVFALDLERDQEEFTDFALCGITGKIRKTRVRFPPFTLFERGD